MSENDNVNDGPSTTSKEDVVICVEGDTFQCSREALSRASSYFAAMFASNMVESTAEQVTLKDVSKDIFSVLLDFTKTGKVNIDSENVLELFKTASMLHFEDVVKKCTDTLLQDLTIHNSVETYLLADSCGVKTLYSKARAFSLWNFSQICLTGSFLDLPIEAVMDYLSQDGLNCASEDQVLHCAMRWISHDGQTRKSLFDKLKSVIRWSLVNEKTIENIESSVLEEHNDLVVELKKMEQNKWDVSSENELLHSCTPRQVPHALMMFGKRQPVAESEQSQDDLCDNKDLPLENWIYIPSQEESSVQVPTCPALKQVPQGFSIAVVGCDLYLCGGEYRLGANTWLFDVWRYSSMQNEWDIVSQLPGPSRHSSLLGWDDQLILLGGFGRYRIILDKVWKMSTSTGEWDKMPAMLHPEFSAATCVCDNKLYVIKSSIQCYTPEVRQWSYIQQELPFAQGIKECYDIGSIIYMPLRETCSIAIYDTRGSQVTAVSGDTSQELMHAFDYIDSTRYGGVVYVIGGSANDTRQKLYVHNSTKKANYSEYLPNITNDSRRTFEKIIAFPCYMH